MPAGAAAYPGSVETMQTIGDAQLQKSVPLVQTTQQQQHQVQLQSQQGPLPLVDGAAVVVPTDSLVRPQQQQALHHNHQQQQQQQHPHLAQLPPMATIVTAAGATPILVASTQPVGPIAVAIATGPSGAMAKPHQAVPSGLVIDYAQLNGGGGGAVLGHDPVTSAEGAGAVVGGAEYYLQTAAPGQEVQHESLVMGPRVPGVPIGLGPVATISDGTPIPFDQLKQLLQTQLEYYFSR